MAKKELVNLIDYLDTGRQIYNEGIATFYNTDQNKIPLINGILKSLFNPEGKSKLLGLINDKWVTLAYEDPIPTDILYYDIYSRNIIAKADIVGKNATFNNINALDIITHNINSRNGTINSLTVNHLNVVDSINQTTTQTLIIDDNTILLNSNLTGNPDTTNYLYAGLEIKRGEYYNSSIKWDETKDIWILSIPKNDNNIAKTVELTGITIDNNRRFDINDSSGIYYDNISASRNPGSYITHENYVSGIYWDNNIKKYVVKDELTNFELVGVNLLDSKRILKLNNSAGIQVFNKSNEFAALDFIRNNNANEEESKGSLVYDHNRQKMIISTKDKTFEIKDIDEIEPFGDSWYYSVDLNIGDNTILLPNDKPIYNTDEGLLMIYINGVHIKPSMYQVIDQNRILLNKTLAELSTVTIYHHVFMSENYRLPIKSIPQYITGISGKEVFVSHSSGAITGEVQSLVIKNNKILIENTHYTLDRITETTLKIIFIEALVETDELTVYPLLTPNIFVKGNNALVFDTYLANPNNDINGTAHILFKRGSSPSAGLRWNEATNNIEVDTGTGIWEPFTGSNTKFDKRRYVISEISNTLNISQFLLDNYIIPDNSLHLTVFKNGFQMDDPSDYTRVNNNIVFTNSLALNDIVWVYLGKSFIKSSNNLLNLKNLQVIQEDSRLLTFNNNFKYEPGTDSLNIFVNGVLTQKDIDYIELNENSVMFNYRLEKGSVIQSFTPIIIETFKSTKKVFEFNITDSVNFLTSPQSNCFITVNRGAANSASIKWDEVTDHWYLNNGDGNFSRIVTEKSLTSSINQRYFEYTNITGTELDISNISGIISEIVVFMNGKLIPTNNYSLNNDNKKVEFLNNTTLNSTDIIGILIYINNAPTISNVNINNQSLDFSIEQSLYRDDSPLGNWYIKSNRGSDLSSVYLKWDEVDNNFKFNDGKNREYTIPKIVFANDFFTPKEGEELILIHKGINKQYAYYNSEWHEI